MISALVTALVFTYVMGAYTMYASMEEDRGKPNWAKRIPVILFWPIIMFCIMVLDIYD